MRVFRNLTNDMDSWTAWLDRNIDRYLTAMAFEAERERIAWWAELDDVPLADYPARLAPYRAATAHMLGYPPPGEAVEPAVAIDSIGEDETGTLYRIRYALLAGGLESYGLLIVPPEPVANLPLAVTVHGGASKPEAASGVYRHNPFYHDMAQQFARRGYVTWMPATFEHPTTLQQLLRLDLHHELDDRARLAGTRIAGINIYTIIRSTEIMLGLPLVGRDRALVVGMSYGGFNALAAAALSEMYVGAIASCAISARRARLEHYITSSTFTDMLFDHGLEIATEIELCRLVCPRPLCFQAGQHDLLVPHAGAEEVAAIVQADYARLGVSDRFSFDSFEGWHEFYPDGAFAHLARVNL
jgi:hypothetical protein